MTAKLPLALDDQTHWRAVELDALSAILPIDRRDQLALLLTDDEIGTLKHLAEKGMGENTLRALTSDLGYLEAWAQAATGEPLPWPAPPGLILKFIAHHLWDQAEKAKDDSHGMPESVETALRGRGILRKHGPMPLRRSNAAWPAGARCTAGEGYRAISRTLPSNPPTSSPYGLPRARAAAKASAP